MLKPAIRIMNEYKPLLVKLKEDASVKNPTKLSLKYFSGLTDVQIIVGLTCLMPMLRMANGLMKATQKNDVFVCDYLAAIKIFQRDPAQMYIEPQSRFTHELFWDFNSMVNVTHDMISMKWETDPLDLNAERVEFLCFMPKEDIVIRACYIDPVTKQARQVTREIYTAIIDIIKAQASGNLQFYLNCLLILFIHLVSTTEVTNCIFFGSND
jgi:hypothetical protein